MAGNISNTGLAQFILQRFKEYKGQKDKSLKAKLQANLDAMERRDDHQKRSFKKDEGKDWRSKVYLPITKAKVYAVWATLCEIELKGDTLPFSLKMSPYEQEKLEQDEEAKKQAEQDMDVMEDKIHEQVKDFGAVKEFKKKILSKCIYGMAWSKFHVKPIKRSGWNRTSFMPPGFGEPVQAFEHWEKLSKVPGHQYRSVWNMFWDIENEDVQKGSGLIERSMISPYEARQKGKNGAEDWYIKEHIEKVIKEHRTKAAGTDDEDQIPGLREIAHRKVNMVNLEFWGRAPRRLVEEFEKTIEGFQPAPGEEPYKAQEFNLTTYQESDEESGDDVEIMAEVIDEEVVRFVRTEPEQRPYKLSLAEMTLDGTQPSGVADNMDAVQYTGNGLVRGLLDNLRLASDVILAGKSRMLADGKPESITPGMWLELSESCQDARQAIQQIVIRDVGTSLLPALGLTDKWGDDFSLVPKIMQGSVLPKQKPDTAYEMAQSMENASRYIGALVKGDDDDFTKPEIDEIYQYNMADPDLQDGKGDYNVHATGYQSLQDKMVLQAAIGKLLSLVLSIPQAATEIKIRPHLEKMYQANDLDPDEFFKSEKEKQIEAEAIKRLQAETTAAQGEQMQGAQAAKDQADLAKIEAKGQTDLHAVALKGQTEKEKAEDDFQRSVIKSAMEKLSPIEQAVGKSAIPGRQEGGPVEADQPYVVGEKGPEVIIPGQPGAVIPNRVVEDAMDQYPILKKYGLKHSYSEKPGTYGGIESWGPEETGTTGYERPKDIPLGQFGVEVFEGGNVRPIDVLGDMASHHLVNVDPTVKDHYQKMISSFTPEQNAILQEQYQHAIKNSGEGRPFEQWRDISGIPAWFRGYTFDQWPKDFTDKVYTPEQRQNLDALRKYLGINQ